MKMAELSKRSGFSIATIKYYLREGLLEPGERTSVNQAIYSDSHLDRLRLIRALTKTARLSLKTIQQVLNAIDSEPAIVEAMGAAQDALIGQDETDEGELPPTKEELEARATSRKILHELIESRGWQIHPETPALESTISAITSLRDEDLSTVLDQLDAYAEAADTVARIDVLAVASASSRNEVIRGVVLGTIFRRSLLDSLVLLAQQHHAKDQTS
ncbi:MerR family transcriptional regulator [Flaviflexus massiliensis]|uniref:MerR family transcriptional regulator n=1 Tax=Flaviflexus massiliensis TaxID=1522309 RepID=UPI00097D8D46|nr:MerR family transcriptional regulator [Flaviflexus massiliensis]